MNKFTKFFKNNGSTILTCISVIGVIGTAISVARDTPKAKKILEEAKEEKGEELTLPEKVVTAAPAYIPSMVIGASTVVCIFGIHVFNRKTQASIASAYAILDRYHDEYVSKLKEIHGEEAHKEIVDAITSEKPRIGTVGSFCSHSIELDKDPNEPILFYDDFSKRYFEAPIERVITAEYYVNRNFHIAGGYVSLNEFYSFLGIPEVDGGDELIWQVMDEFYWIDFNHRKVILEDGLECIIIEMMHRPMLESEYDEW